MKHLISATLSKEAGEIYDSWDKGKKSKIISELITTSETIRLHNEALLKARGTLQALLGEALIVVWQKNKKHPLVKRINNALIGTIHHQYWE